MLREFLGADAAAGALAAHGGPGIGKTTLWEAGIAVARERGWRVLCARPSGAEAQLSFAALIDLFDGRRDGRAAGAGSSARALEVALLRAEPVGAPPPAARDRAWLTERAAGAGRGGRLVVAIDDVQWLDPPSADALAFAVRRLEGEPVAFLLARRPGRPSELERALERGGAGAPGGRPAEPRRDAPVAVRAARSEPVAAAVAAHRGVDVGQPVVRAGGGARAGRARAARDRRGHPGAGRGRGNARHARGAAVGPGAQAAARGRAERRPRVRRACARSADPGAVEDAVDAGRAGRRAAIACARRTRCSPRRRRSARALASGGRFTSSWPARSPTRSCAPAISRSPPMRPDEMLAATVAAAAADRVGTRRAPGGGDAGRARAATDPAGLTRTRRARARPRRVHGDGRRAAAASRIC